MTEASVCTFCTVSCVELQPLQSGGASCGICRALDRIKGVCWRLGRNNDPHSLAVLRETEGRLRDWIGFPGPPPHEIPGYRPEAPGGLIRSLLPARPKAIPKSGFEPPAEPAPISNRPEGRSRSPPLSSGAGEGGSRKKRRKANKGTQRASWQDTRYRLGHSRHRPSIELEEFPDEDDDELS